MFGLDIFLKGVQNILSLDQTVFDEHWIFESVSRLGVPEVTSVAYDESQGAFKYIYSLDVPLYCRKEKYNFYLSGLAFRGLPVVSLHY